MKNKTKPSIWMERPYIDYLSEVDRLLYDQYGITTDDTDLAMVASAQETGDSPQDHIDWLAEHFDLQLLPKEM